MTRLRWLCPRVCQHVTTWSTRVSSFQPVLTQNTQEGYTHLTGSTWNQGGQGKRKDTRGRVKSAFSPLTESHMDLRSHPGAPVGSSLHLTLCIRADYQGSRQGSGSKHTPKQQHTAFIHMWYPDWDRLARAGNDAQLEESCIGGITQMYWGISGSCPLM